MEAAIKGVMPPSTARPHPTESRGKAGSKAAKRGNRQGTEQKTPGKLLRWRAEEAWNVLGLARVKRPVQAEVIGLKPAGEESGHGEHSKLRNEDVPKWQQI
ncbi:hypothetical protein AJ79_04626 [Helicocarpus griseus UAMH5409]|uniref:Uncharacterized protein n=1 Tax=Helicocarpus griseus UAMH5409 TaxID=1447875 RepID=A0A2B7XS92_9EURO|nr:hypothetical protein AJ79_04626 [Helicocarpus griseus UAMH5409]